MRRRPRVPLSGLYCIVLGAGASTRLGRPKQLLRLGARSLLTRAVELGGRLTPCATLLVIGSNAIRLRRHSRRFGRNLSIVYNANWEQGIGSSIGAGVRALPPGARAALILLCDQPGVSAADLRRLLNVSRRRPGRPVAAHYDGHAGVPAIFPRRFFRELRNLSGDEGARRLLRGLPGVQLVPMPSARFDVDTPDDARLLAARAASRDRARRFVRDQRES
jgi:molybdenum cofactor cytidylyltransferase